MISAFAAANGVVIRQIKTDAKSNEIKAIPDQLDIKGCLITIDAMVCRHKITKAIIDNGADYLIAVKDNQKRFDDSIKQALASANKASTLHMEKGHGRVEACEYPFLDGGDIAKTFLSWPGLKIIGMAINYRYNAKKSYQDTAATLALPC